MAARKHETRTWCMLGIIADKPRLPRVVPYNSVKELGMMMSRLLCHTDRFYITWIHVDQISLFSTSVGCRLQHTPGVWWITQGSISLVHIPWIPEVMFLPEDLDNHGQYIPSSPLWLLQWVVSGSRALLTAWKLIPLMVWVLLMALTTAPWIDITTYSC